MDNLVKEIISAFIHSIDVGMKIEIKSIIDDPHGK